MCGGQNFGVAVGGCGGLLNKMRKMRQFFTKLPKFLAVAGNFGGIQSSWGGFAENCLVTLPHRQKKNQRSCVLHRKNGILDGILDVCTLKTIFLINSKFFSLFTIIYRVKFFVAGKQLEHTSHKKYCNRILTIQGIILGHGVRIQKSLSELLPQQKCPPPNPVTGLEPGTSWGAFEGLKMV